jgi:hypothetical protein
MRRQLVIAAAAVALVAGCGAAPPAPAQTIPAAATSQDAASPAAASPSATGPTRPSADVIARYVRAYRIRFPDLARHRTAKGIGNDVDNACGDLARGEPLADVQHRVAARITTTTATPTPAEVAQVVELIRAHCHR